MTSLVRDVMTSEVVTIEKVGPRGVVPGGAADRIGSFNDTLKWTMAGRQRWTAQLEGDSPPIGSRLAASHS